MNRKGFGLIELIGCLALLGLILGIGLYVTRDTLSTSLSTLTDVSVKQIKDAAVTYVTELKLSWINSNDEEYTCVTVEELIDAGYFHNDDVISYKDNFVKVFRNSKTRVIENVEILNECE